MARITQDDALRQAREMHARARPAAPPPPPAPPEPPPAPTPEGPLDPLFRDSERSLLLALLLLLTDEGNHHELMAKRGKYYDLFTTQAKRYLEGGRDVDEEDRPHRRPPRHHSDDGEERPRRRPSFEE